MFWAYFCLIILFSLEQVFAAVSVTISSAAPIMITPNVDVVRQIVTNLSLEADQSYTVEINDDNGGVLMNGAASIPYRISYNNNPEVALSVNPVLVESGSSITGGLSSVAVTILGSDTATATAGDYSTTLTITVTGF